MPLPIIDFVTVGGVNYTFDQGVAALVGQLLAKGESALGQQVMLRRFNSTQVGMVRFADLKAAILEGWQEVVGATS